ncbi:unnamed protein product [Colias eurytheme]|nr:unnamed protein product [Colias eurytheme]
MSASDLIGSLVNGLYVCVTGPVRLCAWRLVIEGHGIGFRVRRPVIRYDPLQPGKLRPRAVRSTAPLLH